MPNDAKAPLAGVRVLDASRVLAAPFCGQLLGDLAREVLKVERPGQGDETRAWGPPFYGEYSAYFLSCNRNKKGVALDLAQPEGLELFYRLAEKSDIVLENFRAASAARLGLGPDKLLARNPRLIVCSISGFGRTGPWSDLPGYDFAVQGLSGLMDITGPVEGPPSKVGVAVTDVLTGLHAAVAVLACLHARAQSGHGYAIDLALLDCAVASQVNLVQAYLTSGAVPKRQGNAHLQIVPYQAFQTADDWLILAIGNDGQWQRFCAAAGRSDLGQDQRFATNSARVQNREVLVPLLEEVLRHPPCRELAKKVARRRSAARACPQLCPALRRTPGGGTRSARDRSRPRRQARGLAGAAVSHSGRSAARDHHAPNAWATHRRGHSGTCWALTRSGVRSCGAGA